VDTSNIALLILFRFRQNQIVRGIALVVTFTLLFPWGEAKAQTLGTMVHYCEKLETYWRQYPPTKENMTFPNDALGASCAGFINGFWHASSLVDPPMTVPMDGDRPAAPYCTYAFQRVS
jgi:hypothetical protein